MIQLDFSGMIKAIKEWAISKIPTKTSQLNNDSGFPVSSDVIDTYEELNANTQSGKFAGALGVNEGFTDVNGKLTNENNETFNFGVKDGVRGFFTNPSRADDSFIPFKSVEPMAVFGWLAGTQGVARAWAEIGNFSTVTITTGSSIKIQVSNELDASSGTSGTQIATGSATIDLTQYKDTYKYIGVAGGNTQYVMEFS